MGTIQALLHTIWATIVQLGALKVIIAIIIIALISRANKLLGTVAAVLFIAYLAHWI